MRTKALLLAAFAAAGVATSMAQVYSVNAVGYVNVSVPPGFSMVSNPLDAADNKASSLFKNFQQTIPGGLKLFIFKNGGFLQTVQWEDIDQKYIPEATAAETVVPGEGVFVFNPSNTTLTLTFVGQVPQGQLSNPLPKGFSIKANQVPQAGNPTTYGLPAQGGDKVFVYNTTKKGYDSWLFDDIDSVWQPLTGQGGGNQLPSIAVGQAFFLFRNLSAGTWTRNFNVNNPS
jgi:hypothetical protein